MEAWLVAETLKSGVIQGILIGLLGVAFAWVYHTTRVFHIALAVPVMTGAYVAIYVYRAVGIEPIAAALAGVAAIFVSLVIGIIYHRLQVIEASNSLRLVASLGVYFICAGGVALSLGPDIKTSGLASQSSLALGDVIFTGSDQRYLILGLVASVGLLFLLRRLPLGIQLVALAENRRLFLALGKSEILVVGVVLLVSGLLAGVVGALEGLRNGADPYGFLPVTISAAVAALLSGRSLLFGPLAAGLCLGLLHAATIQIISDRWADAVVFGLLLLLLTFGPSGLLAAAQEEERA